MTNDIPKPSDINKLRLAVGKAVKESGVTTEEAAEQLRENPIKPGEDFSKRTKPVFVRKPHLMVKPFKDLGEALQGLGTASEGLGESLNRVTKIPDNKYPTPKGRRRNNKEKK